MNLKFLFMLVIGCIIQPIEIIAQDSQLAYDTSKKEFSILEYRDYFSKNSYRGHSLKSKKSLDECLNLLSDDGVFTDLKSQQGEIIANKLPDSHKMYLTRHNDELKKNAQAVRLAQARAT